MKAALRREGVRYRQDTCTHSVVVQRSSVGFRAVVATPHAHRTHTSPAHTHPHIPGLAWNTMTHTHTDTAQAAHSPSKAACIHTNMHKNTHSWPGTKWCACAHTQTTQALNSPIKVVRTQLAWNTMGHTHIHRRAGLPSDSNYDTFLQHNDTHTHTSKSWLAFRQ